MTASELRVEFCGEEYSAAQDETLTFGRSADIVLDENRFLHRVLGEFSHSNGLWWLRNVGSSIAVTLHDDGSPSMSRIAPGSSVPVVFAASTVRFDAGGTTYEMTLDLVGDDPDDAEPNDAENSPASDVAVDETAIAEMTTTTTSIPLTDDQFALLLALARPLLSGGDSLPTNRQLASSLEWTVTKWNRKLDGLCTKFAKAGVTGLHGSADRLAKDRRMRLAEHVVHSGIVRPEHLQAPS